MATTLADFEGTEFVPGNPASGLDVPVGGDPVLHGEQQGLPHPDRRPLGRGPVLRQGGRGRLPVPDSEWRVRRSPSRWRSCRPVRGVGRPGRRARPLTRPGSCGTSRDRPGRPRCRPPPSASARSSALELSSSRRRGVGQPSVARAQPHGDGRPASARPGDLAQLALEQAGRPSGSGQGPCPAGSPRRCARRTRSTGRGRGRRSALRGRAARRRRRLAIQRPAAAG